MSEILNPKDCKVCDRWLVRDYQASGSPYEVSILEWSPSGKRVRVRYESDSISWLEDLPYKVEKLPSLTVPMPASDQREGSK